MSYGIHGEMISIIIPTLNEERNISKIFSRINEANALHPFESEVIFVDDQSGDRTQELILKEKERNPRVRLVLSPQRRGLGAALKLGVKEAQGSFILFLDCDASVSARDLSRLIESRKERCMMIGSRYIKGSAIHGARLYKVVLSKILNHWVSRYLRVSARDISHSLRIFPSQSLPEPVNNSHPAYFWELSLLAKKAGMKIGEIPVTFTEREFGVSKNTIAAMVVSCLRGIRVILTLKGAIRS